MHSDAVVEHWQALGDSHFVSQRSETGDGAMSAETFFNRTRVDNHRGGSYLPGRPCQGHEFKTLAPTAAANQLQHAIANFKASPTLLRTDANFNEQELLHLFDTCHSQTSRTMALAGWFCAVFWLLTTATMLRGNSAENIL